MFAAARTPRQKVSVCFFILYTAAMDSAEIATDPASLVGMGAVAEEIRREAKRVAPPEIVLGRRPPSDVSESTDQ